MDVFIVIVVACVFFIFAHHLHGMTNNRNEMIDTEERTHKIFEEYLKNRKNR